MDKNKIKAFLRESLFSRIKEAPKKQSQKAPKPADEETKIETEYAEIINGFKGLGAPTQADIMEMAGLGIVGDKTAEALFGKKLRREKNDEGSVYQFDAKERASIIKAQARARK